MYIAKQIFTVVGLSSSGKGAAEALLKRGAKVFIFDDDKQKRSEKTALKLISSGAVLAKSAEAAIAESDVVVVSPGVKIDAPFLVDARRNGKRIKG